MFYHLTPISSNIKTGPIPVTTTSRDSCPDACPFKKNGCYADQAPLVFHWNAVTAGKRGTDNIDQLCESIAKLKPDTFWRHNQAGDLPTKDRVKIDKVATNKIVRANKGKKGFTFSHFDIETSAHNRFSA